MLNAIARPLVGAFARALSETGHSKCFILFLRQRLLAKVKLAAEIFIIWCHAEVQPHVSPEELLGWHLAAIEADTGTP